MNRELEKKPDEDKIESILVNLHRFAFYNQPWEDQILTDFKWILEEWEKVLGNDNLTEYLKKGYIRELEDNIKRENYENARAISAVIDLISCFFQHYIYAFDDFIRRGYRNAIMRCGLICERFMNRLMLISGHRELISSDKKNIKFESQVGRLQDELNGKIGDIDYFCSANRHIYDKRTKKSVHDIGVGGEILTKSIISLIPNLYRLYLDILEHFGIKIVDRYSLEEIVNNTILTKTSMNLSIKSGIAKSIDEVIRSAYRNGFFEGGKSLKNFKKFCENSRYNFPPSTVYDGLKRACEGKSKFLYKKNKQYSERVPPSEYFL